MYAYAYAFTFIPSTHDSTLACAGSDVFNNSLTGDLPTSIRDLASLKEMYVDNEHLLPLRRRYCGQRLPN
eukprot:CAMPEP_0174734778 /NCGR_PEP_ID=MMETSP1094-20130205/63892_1 /TAXON_ID=156173 /ORGANISM="Chrysochromulina brevifilum, Strain UTEX LB 985" /LENGTH=69 /DNA_ID=CAMNT_0015937647 /DNA_START=84 /DNA_END=290 /DNA_ORIENTATION=-